jgi:hypothetical protein
MRERMKQPFNDVMNGLTFGLEVEVTGINMSRAHQVAHEINHSQGFANTRQAFKAVRDGSVDSGAEFVSGIMRLAHDIEGTQEAVRMIRRAGGRPHYSCGIHVHIGGSEFIQNPQALIRLIKLVYRYEDHLYHALGADTPARRGRWAQPVKTDFLNAIKDLPKTATIDDIRDAWYTHNQARPNESRTWNYNSSRYRMLNLHALFTKGTIEFRCFNASTHAGVIKSYIQLSAMMCAFALVASRATTGKRTFNSTKTKFEVRTFLLKIGAIGDEYKTLRLHLLKHCTGSTAWHTTPPRSNRSNEAQQGG